VEQAQADLARRLGIDPREIEVVVVEAVVWPDGGLGCPEPGAAYTQVQIDGLRIRLRAGEQVYSYHAGGGQAPFLCERATEDAEDSLNRRAPRNRIPASFHTRSGSEQTTVRALG
jgi:hypothetical protein